MSSLGLFNRLRGYEEFVTPSPLDTQLGAFDAEAQMQQMFDDEAQGFYEVLKPHVDAALQHLARGEMGLFKPRCGKFKKKSAKRGGLHPSYEVLAASSFVCVYLYGYYGGGRVQQCFEEFYGAQGHGYVVRENRDPDGVRSRYNIFICLP